MQWEFAAILTTLRGIMKAKKVRYEDLAQSLGVSLPTIKRLFAGHEPSIGRLIEICNVLAVSFFDVADLSRQHAAPRFVLSEEQEVVLAASPDLYAYFRFLTKGETPASIAEKASLSVVEQRRYLRALEDLALIERLPGDRVRLRHAGQIQWQSRGPLRHTLLHEQNLCFLREVEDETAKPSCYHVVECEMAPATLERLIEELSSVTEKYRALSNRDVTTNAKSNVTSVRWLSVAASYQTDWIGYFRRSPLKKA